MPRKPVASSKSGFVRQQPASLSAAEVVKKAKDAGISITSALVYKVRAKGKTSGKAKAKGKAKVAVKSKVAAAAPAKKEGTMNASEFVRSLPAETPIAQVMAKATAAGYKFPVGFVSLIRNAAKRHAAKKSAPAAAHATREAPVVKKRGRGKKFKASDFIRAQPLSISAKEVAAKGAAEGFTFKPSLVYTVRAAVAKKGGHKPAAAPHAAPVAHAAPAARAVNHHAAGSSNKSAFRKLMIRLGLDVAESLYAEVHRELKAIEDR